VTPPALAYGLLCLPPILHMQFQIPMSSYSKGAQGLSVFLRERGIFTAISISPSLWPRQCGDRYAIRAGRTFKLYYPMAFTSLSFYLDNTPYSVFLSLSYLCIFSFVQMYCNVSSTCRRFLKRDSSVVFFCPSLHFLLHPVRI